MWGTITSALKNIKNPIQKIAFFGTGAASGGYFSNWYNSSSKKELADSATNIDNQKKGMWISTSTRFGPPRTRFVADTDFQGFFEYYMNHCFEIDYKVLKKAINIDYNNLKLFKSDQKTLFFEKLAVGKSIEALQYCEVDQNGKYRIHDFALEKYGKSVYEYIPKP